MTAPLSIISLRIRGDTPSQDDILREVGRLHCQYADIHEPLKQMGETIQCNATVGSVDGFPDINQLLQLANPDTAVPTISFVAINLVAKLVSVITFPYDRPAMVMLDRQSNSHIAGLKNVVSTHASPATAELSPRDEVRHLLAGISRNRRGLFLAGSPGWSAPSKQMRLRAAATNKNDASLAATLNDANSFFHVFHSLTADDHLTGLVAGFLIREKQSLRKMLEMLPFDADAHGNTDTLSPLIPERGLITFDTKLRGSVDNQGRATIIGGPGIGFGETVGERMHNTSHCGDRTGQFAIIYYSGHGSAEGNLQIENTLAITPDEVCEISHRTGVPYLLILDMCHSSRFGQRYVDVLSKRQWPGIVMCANDHTTSKGLSFESTRMGFIRRPFWTFDILSPDWSKGRGIYSTAFTLAIEQLREHETMNDTNANITLQDFNDAMLRPICEGFASQFDMPLLRPTVYCNP